MSDKLQSLEIERAEKYKEYKQKTMYGIFGFVAAGLILLVALGFDFPVLAIIVVVIAAVVGVVFIGMASKIAVDYSKKAKSKLVRLLLEEMYTNVKYDMN